MSSLKNFIKGKVKSYSHSIPEKLMKMLEEKGVSSKLKNSHLRCCIVNIFGRDYQTICIKNDSDSPVVFSSQLNDLPLVVGRSDITTIKGRQKGIFKSCVLFENYLDYLAYLSSDIMIPGSKDFDMIIMGDFKSFPKLLIKCQTYDHIYSCFSNTEYGQTMMETVHHRADGHSISFESLYTKFDSIKEYNLSKIKK